MMILQQGSALIRRFIYLSMENCASISRRQCKESRSVCLSSTCPMIGFTCATVNSFQRTSRRIKYSSLLSVPVYSRNPRWLAQDKPLCKTTHAWSHLTRQSPDRSWSWLILWQSMTESKKKKSPRLSVNWADSGPVDHRSVPSNLWPLFTFTRVDSYCQQQR